jgi:hypothetical protein
MTNKCDKEKNVFKNIGGLFKVARLLFSVNTNLTFREQKAIAAIIFIFIVGCIVRFFLS